jgi:hypothetical protein
MIFKSPRLMGSLSKASMGFSLKHTRRCIG